MRLNTVDPGPEVEQLLRDLEAAVVALGGRELPEPCTPRPFSSLSEDPRDATCGCGNNTRFVLPYESEDGTPGEAVVCANCDWPLRWPVMGGNA